MTAKLCWFAEAMTTPDTPIDWVIDKLIAEGDRVVVYGQWRAFKTYLLADWAVRVSGGLALGSLFAVPKPRRVLYVNEEMSDRAIRRRLKRLAKGLGVIAQELPLAFVSRSGLKLKEKHPSIQRLLAYIAEAGLQPGDVLIIDALRRVLIGSEKDDEAVRAFWDCVDAVLVPLGLTIIIAHHMRKPRGKPGGQPTTHEASGSGDIMAGGDNTIAVTRDEGDSITIYQEKNREAEEAAPFTATFDFSKEETGPLTVAYAPGTGFATKQQDPGNLAKLCHYLANHPKVKWKDILAGAGIPKGSLTRVVKQAKKSGLVSETNSGYFYLLSGQSHAA